MNLTIGYYYPDLLNLYGDNGNVEILKYRAEKRNISVTVVPITLETKVDDSLMNSLNFVFMGGGPDSSQKNMYDDLVHTKGTYLRNYIENGGTGLFICGAYQLLGHYYKASDGSVLNGLGIFDLYTEHFGKSKPRCIGNLYVKLNTPAATLEPYAKLKNRLVGFENHGGRTYLGKGVQPLAQVIKGYGNNGEDQTEGAIYKNAYGSYSHGPLLAKNPHFADFLIMQSLKLAELPFLGDTLSITAHLTASKLT